MKTKTVFLSSTYKDLDEFRNNAYNLIEGLDGFHCVRMEDFGSRVELTTEFCISKVKECDLFIGIIGPNYGSSPKGSDKSFTEIEYETAKKYNKPCLVFMTSDQFKISIEIIEDDSKREKQDNFRSRILKSQIVSTFDSNVGLSEKLLQGIRNWENKYPPSVCYSFYDKYIENLESHILEDFRRDQFVMMSVEELENEDSDTLLAIQQALRSSFDIVVQEEYTINSKRQSLTSAIDRVRLIALLGDPGIGKTYALRYLALKQIDNLRNNKDKLLPIWVSLGKWEKKEIQATEFLEQEFRFHYNGNKNYITFG